MKICFVLATRPEIIKTSPIIKIFEKNKLNFFLIHTGQHYTNYLDNIFFKELGLPNPKYNLEIRSRNPVNEAEHTGKMMIRLESIILKEQPDFVMVHGDTNTTLAGALTVRKLFTKINFLNIDCEGHDYNVLSSIDLGHYSPELICIETQKINNEETIMYQDIIKLLKNYSYKIFKRCGPSTFFNK